jgi:hypothetical protein
MKGTKMNGEEHQQRHQRRVCVCLCGVNWKSTQEVVYFMLNRSLSSCHQRVLSLVVNYYFFLAQKHLRYVWGERRRIPPFTYLFLSLSLLIRFYKHDVVDDNKRKESSTKGIKKFFISHFLSVSSEFRALREESENGEKNEDCARKRKVLMTF